MTLQHADTFCGLSYQYNNPHVKGKTVLRLSYRYHGNPHTWKDDLYIETGPDILHQSIFIDSRKKGILQ